MSSYKEDEEYLALIQKMYQVAEELESYNKNEIKIVEPSDAKDRLKKLRNELYDQYMSISIELDRIRIRESPYKKSLIEILRKIYGYGPLNIDEIWSDYFQVILGYHQDNELINRGDFVRNYFKLIPPYVKVGTNIPEGIKNIYYESRWCFVYGQYSAAVSLCRSVTETVLRNKFFLEGDLSEVIQQAKKRKLITYETSWKVDKVRCFANKIMHKAMQATEKEAKNAIDHTLVFLEEIYG